MKKGSAASAPVRFGASFAALAATLLLGSPALAQDAGVEDETVVDDGAPVSAEDTVGEEIVVTGSRIARSGFTAPTPVTVVGQEQIARQGASNIAQILNE